MLSNLEFARAVGVTCSPFLGHPKLEFPGVRAQGTAGAAEPETSDIGGLLPMALWGRTSL